MNKTNSTYEAQVFKGMVIVFINGTTDCDGNRRTIYFKRATLNSPILYGGSTHSPIDAHHVNSARKVAKQALRESFVCR